MYLASENCLCYSEQWSKHELEWIGISLQPYTPINHYSFLILHFQIAMDDTYYA